jgi:hypothetical protein
LQPLNAEDVHSKDLLKLLLHTFPEMSESQNGPDHNLNAITHSQDLPSSPDEPEK